MTKLLIADDESILLKSLAQKLIRFWPESTIISQCASGTEALQALQQYQPDVAFLDIKMGDMSGLEVANQYGSNCHYVFITAFDEYAVSAFEADAIDYLLKPYSDERLQSCIDRVHKRLLNPPTDIYKLISQLRTNKSNLISRITVQIGNRTWLIDVGDIICFIASGRYVRVITPEREALLRQPLKNILNRLDPNQFWQVHRSAIININHMDHVKHVEQDHLTVKMKGFAEESPVSRSSQHLFR